MQKTSVRLFDIFSAAIIYRFHQPVKSYSQLCTSEDVALVLERLGLMEYLFLPRNKYFLNSIDEKISFLEDGMEGKLDQWRSILANDLEGQDGSVIRAVLDGHSPVCIAADGLPVFDDVGGIGGYIDFLTTIHLNEDRYLVKVTGNKRLFLCYLTSEYSCITMKI